MKKKRTSVTSLEAQRLQVELERLAIEKGRAKAARGFLNRQSGAIVAAFISVACLIYVSKVNWSREDAFNNQRKADQARSEQRDIEYRASEQTQQTREWDLQKAQFVLANQERLFNGKPEQLKFLAGIISTTFPTDVSVALLERLEQTATPSSRAIWREAKVKIQAKPQVAAQESASLRTELREAEPTRSGLGAYSSYSSDTSISPLKVSSSLASLLNEPRVDIESFGKHVGAMNSKALEISGGFQPLGTGDFVGETGKPGVDVRLLSADRPIYVSGLTTNFVSEAGKILYGAQSSNTDSLISVSGISAGRLLDPSSLAVVTKRTIEISGFVVDRDTRSPIDGAMVTLESSESLGRDVGAGRTDSSGHFRIVRELDSWSIPFQLKVTITRDGYTRKATEVQTFGGAIPISLATIALERGATD